MLSFFGIIPLNKQILIYNPQCHKHLYFINRSAYDEDFYYILSNKGSETSLYLLQQRGRFTPGCTGMCCPLCAT